MTGVYKARITANWFDNDARFWYRNDLRGGDKEFILVDAEQGIRQAAFDHQKLAASLSKASGEKYAANRLPFESIEFVEDGRSIQFKVNETTWKCDLNSYDCLKMEENGAGLSPGAPQPAATERADQDQEDESSLLADLSSPYAQQQSQEVREKNQGEDDDRPIERRELIRSVPSKDGKWTAFIKDENVYVRAEDGGKEFQLSQDGKPGLGYGMLQRAPDSQTLVAFRIEPGDNKEVYLIESSPKAGGRAVLHTRHYDLPGDKFTAFELNLFSPADQKQIKPEVDRIDFGFPRLRWNSDGRRFTYEKSDRGHQRFRVIEVDSHTGQARNIIDEKTETFIWTAHTENGDIRLVNWLDKSDEIIYVSERDGWRHLYLIDAQGRSAQEPDHQGRVGRARHRPHRRGHAPGLVPCQRQKCRRRTPT